MLEFSFRSISLEQMDKISPNFIYAFILRRFRLGLLPVIFCKFVIELWPLIGVRIYFPFNILRKNRQNFTKFCICIDIDKIQGIFCKLVAELWPYVDVDWDFYAHLAFLQHKKRCSRAIVRSSDNSSLSWNAVCFYVCYLYFMN